MGGLFSSIFKYSTDEDEQSLLDKEEDEEESTINDNEGAGNFRAKVRQFVIDYNPTTLLDKELTALVDDIVADLCTSLDVEEETLNDDDLLKELLFWYVLTSSHDKITSQRIRRSERVAAKAAKKVRRVGKLKPIENDFTP